ncbi:lamin tail domain-containing protein [Chitinibacter fontanus]|uniref:Lamin tail domain-containing protein n=1 Tax=Chitinibacter fontanus TaxID=1737446 RepID=A0A7D5ZHT8_9NEIS|nr:carbohydrate-binding protein [Chitinibacter fontanus]QLI82129.1 lamin tail domain-containing protein [Chitinibacter fontanus]
MRKNKLPKHAMSLLGMVVLSSSLWAASPWQEGQHYRAGAEVTFQGQRYQARVSHEALVGAGWNPKQAAALWLPVSAAATSSSPATNAGVSAGTSACPAVWSSSAIYVAGNQVNYNGRNYQAKWWTKGEIPSTTGQWGVWLDLGVCAASSATATPVSNTPAPTATPQASPAVTATPTVKPTPSPVATPSATPTVKPTASPTPKPSATPTPSAVPTATPSATPTVKPTASPTPKPSATPAPSAVPTATPSAAPTVKPTASPTPSIAPTPQASAAPVLGLVINEVASDPNGTGSWFEIRNASGSSVNLAELKVRVRNNSNVISEFAVGSGTLANEGLLVLAAKTGAAGQLNTNQIIYLGQSSNYPRWTSNSGAIELVRNGVTADFVRFGSSSDQPLSAGQWSGSNAAALSNNYGYALVRPYLQSADSNTAADWQNVAFSTPGGRNDVPAGATDDDGDGIPSTAKVAGGTYAGLDLYAMGVRAGRPSVLIQLDSMQSTDEGVKPQREALQAVVDAFARRNIDVLFDVGNLYSASFSPVNFNLGGGKTVAFAACADLAPVSGCSGIADYKAGSMDIRRRQIFHYLLMASSRNLDGSSGSSGVAEIGGNDFIVSLGKWGLNSSTASNRYRLINYQAGTIMHELGHNLGLRHGGFENTNYKPNYYSIMNYLYQLQGLGDRAGSIGPVQRYYLNKGYYSLSSCALEGSACSATYRIDYSDGSSERMNENALNEALSIGRGVDAGIYADWNNSRALNTATYALDVNGDGALGYLQDYDDWGNIALRFARTSQGSAGAAMLRSTESNERQIAKKSRAFMHDKFEHSVEDAPHAEFFHELKKASPYAQFD